MLSRIRSPKSPVRSKKGVSATDGVNSLIGDTGVSLDGESLMLPDEAAMKDEGSLRDDSSIGTSNYGDPSRPMKSFAVIDGDEPSMLGDDHSITAGVPPNPPPPPPKVISAGASVDATDEGLVPKWVKTAPPYFRVIIIFSIALLVGAIVLVIVAAALSGNDGGSSADGIVELTFPPTVPTQPPGEPSAAPSTAEPTITAAPTVTPAPTDFPSVSPTDAPTAEGSPGTLSPTEPGGGIVTFYVIAGRFQGTNLEELPDRLATLPADNGREFLVHLGDWNSPFATGCDEESYQTVEELYSTSSVPVYFVVGDNEFNDCPDPGVAIGFWYDYLLDYETEHWPEPSFTVNRQVDEGYSENFSFFFNGILFVGINLVGGEVKDQDEWDQRLEFNQIWIDNNVEAFPSAQTLVVFAHADPDIQATTPFFDTFYESAGDYDMTVKFIHRNLGVETAHTETVEGVDNLELLIVEGQAWPPMRVQINAAGDVFEFDQDDWYEDEVGGR